MGRRQGRLISAGRGCRSPDPIIDGAPSLSNMATSAIKAADLILVPVQPSSHDIWATAKLVDQIKQRIELTDQKLKAAFIVSRVIPGTRLGKEIAGALAEFALPVLRSAVTQRITFPTASSQGLSVLDLEPSSQAALEIIALSDEILEFIKER